ncbi:MAG: hypothetical protein AB8B96_08485 [Lysobacterales bacterium]
MRLLLVLLFSPSLALGATDAFCDQHTGVAPLVHPIVFVGQVPIIGDFGNIASTFLNHRGRIQSVPRGGGLFIRYPDGRVCNLTREAGFGDTSFQGAESIAVRDPAIHFSGNKVLFSMVVGGPAVRFATGTYRWQMYEVTGLEFGSPVSITKVPNQPASFNNINATYGSQDQIIFATDRPRNGALHLYPQLDEYESTPIVTGLWSLNPANGSLALLQHSPSGSFDPLVDSFGRIIFTRWDHLQRDQQADGDDLLNRGFGTFDWASEAVGAATTQDRVEYFPEPRGFRTDLLTGTNLNGLEINHFFPWMLNQDGTGEETLNHIGRHELHDFFNVAFNDDSNLIEFAASQSNRVNPNEAFNFFHIAEDPTSPGRYFAIDAPEFTTHTSGNLFAIEGAPQVNPDDMVVTHVTHPETGETRNVAENNGHYRDPVPLSDGRLLSSHVAEKGQNSNLGSALNPDPSYKFRIRELVAIGGGLRGPGQPLTSGLAVNITYFNPDNLVTFQGNLWELSGVEVVSREVPPFSIDPPLKLPESNAFDQTVVNQQRLKNYLKNNDLGLLVARNVTSRDDADIQQPFNLVVPGGVSGVSSAGKAYPVSYFQAYQADQVRGIGGIDSPRPGRRPLARPLHDSAAVVANPAPPPGMTGALPVASDGSVAMFFPARRATSWELLSDTGESVIKERYWITFQPGEVKVCDGCHGVNKEDQFGGGQSSNTPQALIDLLNYFDTYAPLFGDGFED